MIRENQSLFNKLNIISDAVIVFLSLLVAFWMRYHVMPDGVVSVSLKEYMQMNVVTTLIHVVTFAAFGLYGSFRNARLDREVARLWTAALLDAVVIMSLLFLLREVDYSRIALTINFVLGTGFLTLKRVILRYVLKRIRREGYNQKFVLVLGAGKTAKRYLRAVADQPHLGYTVIGCLSHCVEDAGNVHCLGTFEKLGQVLDEYIPDEVVGALEAEDYALTPYIIEECEKAGVKLSIIPFYSEFMPSNPQFDAIGNIPLLNIRRIPLDNAGNAFIKRSVDIVGSAIMLLLLSPIMLISAIGVRLSSPGPVIFSQERLGRHKKPFKMYKFRSMRVNDEVNRWSTDEDDRRTRFGSFIRKFSIDELPQLVNVLKGDMSLVGPRPELEFFAEHFKEEVPLYMVKHQVRPGITGWAQVNDLRGDTSIKARIEHDIYYIEQWNLLFDIKILFMTVFGGKFKNNEKLEKEKV